MVKQTNTIAPKLGKILGVGLTSTTVGRVLKHVQTAVSSGTKLFIVTPNPEIVTLATKDHAYKNILNSADLAVVDGSGLVVADRFLHMQAPKNRLFRAPVLIIQGLMVGISIFVARGWLTKRYKVIKGREMVMELIKLADKKKWRVFFYGGDPGSPREAARKLSEKYKGVLLEAADAPQLDSAGEPVTKRGSKQYKAALLDIKRFKPDILLVGISAPKQEKWISANMRKINTPVFMAVGGTFDYFAEKVPLPPKLVDRLYLEWLWRLITQPTRARRILTATVVFPLRIFWYKLIS